MHLDQFSGIAVEKMAFISSPVGLCFQSGNMIHSKSGVVLVLVIRDEFIRLAQLVCFLSLSTSFSTVFCPELIAKISFALFLQDLFAVWLEIIQIYTVSGAEQDICDLLIGEIIRDNVNAAQTFSQRDTILWT